MNDKKEHRPVSEDVSKYLNCDICMMGYRSHGEVNPDTGKPWGGVRMVKIGKKKVPEGMTVFCDYHAKMIANIMRHALDAGLIEMTKKDKG